MANADRALILRCQANDAAAFNEIVARYKNRIYNFISRMIGPGPDAEDLTQETFVRAYVNMKSFQARAALNTWLFRIATNLCIDHKRKYGKIRALTTSLQRDDQADEEEAERELPDQRYDPERLALNKELGAQLGAALSGLPDILRTVVVLHDIEGLQYDEIAEIAGVPLGTVKSRLFNARAALRKKLGPYVYGSRSSGWGR